MVVAIPARDEEATIVGCLQSIDLAAASCAVPVRVVVAADRCRDRTAQLARGFVSAHCEVSAVHGRWRTVGEARAAAVAAARPGPACWIANTDADCRVPADWLHRQLGRARAGVGAVAGVVRLDPAIVPLLLADRFGEHYAALGRRRHHVHAANMGVHAAAYGRCGGWSAHSQLGEEHHLWDRLRRHQYPILHDDDLWVFTSHRTLGRAPGGFADGLRRLAGEVAP